MLCTLLSDGEGPLLSLQDFPTKLAPELTELMGLLDNYVHGEAELDGAVVKDCEELRGLLQSVASAAGR